MQKGLASQDFLSSNPNEGLSLIFEPASLRKGHALKVAISTCMK